MTIAKLPGIEIRAGQIFNMSLVLKDEKGVGIDLTGWTGKFSVAEDYDEVALVTDVATLDSSGGVAIALTAAQTALLQDVGCTCLVYQIDLDKNDQTDAHRMQGKVSKVYQEIGL